MMFKTHTDVEYMVETADGAEYFKTAAKVYRRPSDRAITEGRLKYMALRLWLADGRPGVCCPASAFRDCMVKANAARLRRIARRAARRSGGYNVQDSH